jgi:hypothetical protein
MDKVQKLSNFESCGILNISKPYTALRPLTGTALALSATRIQFEHLTMLKQTMEALLYEFKTTQLITTHFFGSSIRFYTSKIYSL